MQAIILIGIQATGKSTFYKKRFFNSHVRISIDLLNTRNKENKFLETCLNTQSKFVIDNTNPTIVERSKYIELAKSKKYEIIGYYFHSSLDQALERNTARIEKERVPEIGIKGCYSKLELPNMNEGFDKLYYVKSENMEFQIENWKDEV